MCAALDRQHPRDMFDVKLLMDADGITTETRKAFIIYLASHDRPINELFEPARKNMREVYQREFVGMTKDPVSYEELEQAREQYIKILSESLTQEKRRFLVSIKMAQPEWSLLNIDGIDKLPAIQQKLLNIRKLGKEKHAELLSRLKKKLNIS